MLILGFKGLTGAKVFVWVPNGDFRKIEYYEVYDILTYNITDYIYIFCFQLEASVGNGISENHEKILSWIKEQGENPKT